MTKKEHRRVRSFEAKDEYGKRYIINHFAVDLVCTDLSGTTSRVPGMPYLRTGDGRHVNRLDKGRYEIFTLQHLNGLVLTSNDPNAT